MEISWGRLYLGALAPVEGTEDLRMVRRGWFLPFCCMLAADRFEISRD